MKSNTGSIYVFNEILSKIIELLKNENIEEAKSLISEVMILNMDAPEPHNLLGILYEITGDDHEAKKHFRASYALDHTYIPASKNLERLVNFDWGAQSRDYDFGDYWTQKKTDKKRK